MPLVKLTIRHEPVEVDDDELRGLQGQGLVEEVLDSPESAKPAPARAAVITDPAAAGKPEEH